MQSFMETEKGFVFETKIYIFILLDHMLHHHFRICQNAKFRVKGKKLNLGSNYLGIFGLETKKLLSYLKSTPSNLPKCKVLW